MSKSIAFFSNNPLVVFYDIFGKEEVQFFCGFPGTTWDNMEYMSAINPLVAIYDIHGKGELQLFCCLQDTTPDKM
jgi:hypothetical protein